MRSPIALLFATTLLITPLAHTQTTPTASTKVDLPASTKITAALLRPVWSARVKVGDPIFAVTRQPVIVSAQLSIPAGTYVEGTIDSLTQPASHLAVATLDVQFNQLLFDNGYTVILTNASNPNLPPVRSLLQVNVSSDSDILLDEGAPVTFTLPAALSVNAARIAQAAAESDTPATGIFLAATLCRPTPGTPDDPGTPDVTIPGTPGTPGTPDITIPGVDGAPDTVIPGMPATPATPDTPDTVIPGRPATPGTPPPTAPTRRPSPILSPPSPPAASSPQPTVQAPPRRSPSPPQPTCCSRCSRPSPKRSPK